MMRSRRVQVSWEYRCMRGRFVIFAAKSVATMNKAKIKHHRFAPPCHCSLLTGPPCQNSIKAYKLELYESVYYEYLRLTLVAVFISLNYVSFDKLMRDCLVWLADLSVDIVVFH